MATSTSGKQQTRTNFEIFLDTINSLKYAQGFYSRLAQQIEELREYEPEKLTEIENSLNELPQWSDNVDCIFYLEK